MSTVINGNYANRTYEPPYGQYFSKDPPQAQDKAQAYSDRFEEAKDAVKADFHSYDANRGANHEEMMRVMDPQAYREYQQLKKTSGDTGNPIEEMRFMMNWIEDKAVKDPAMERKFTRQTDALSELEDRFKNAAFKIKGVADKDGAGADKAYSITLTKDELRTLTYGTKEEKEALYKEIEDAMKTIEEAEKQMDDKLPDFDFGIDTKADAAHRFFGILGDESFKADSTESLFKQILERITGKEEKTAEA